MTDFMSGLKSVEAHFLAATEHKNRIADMIEAASFDNPNLRTLHETSALERGVLGVGRLSKNCLLVPFSLVKTWGHRLGPTYYDYPWQFRAVAAEVRRARVDHVRQCLNRIIDKGVTVKKDKIHPEVIEKIKGLMGEH